MGPSAAATSPMLAGARLLRVPALRLYCAVTPSDSDEINAALETQFCDEIPIGLLSRTDYIPLKTTPLAAIQLALHQKSVKLGHLAAIKQSVWMVLEATWSEEGVGYMFLKGWLKNDKPDADGTKAYKLYHPLRIGSPMLQHDWLPVVVESTGLAAWAERHLPIHRVRMNETCMGCPDCRGKQPTWVGSRNSHWCVQCWHKWLLQEASETFIAAMQKFEAKQAKEREHAGLTVLEASPWANGPSSSTSPATGSSSTSDL